MISASSLQYLWYISSFCEKLQADQDNNNDIFNLSRENLPSTLPFNFDELKTFWENRYKGEENEPPGKDKPYFSEDDSKKEFSTHLKRIQTISIENFKGIQKMELDLDADIILISGANGNGKSSFVEAINLAVTGYHPDMTITEDKKPKVPNHFFHYEAENFKITLLGKGKDHKDNEVDITLTTECDRNSDRKLAGIQPDIEYKIQNRTFLVPQQLNFRLTSYLPDHIKLLFDENMVDNREGGRDTDILTIRELFPGMTPEVEALKETAEEQLQKVNDEKKADQKKLDNIETNAAKICDAAGSFFSKLANLLELPHKAIDKYFIEPVEWQGISNSPDSVFKVLKQQKTKIYNYKNLPEAGWASLPENLKRYKENLATDKELTDLEQEKAKLERKIKEREKRIALSISDELSELKNMFSRLADKDYIKKIQTELTKEGLFDVKSEVELVNPDTAGNCAQSLSSRELERKDAMQREVDEAEKQLEEIKKQLEEARKSDRIIQAFDDAQKYIENENNAALLKTMDTFLSGYTKKEELQNELNKHDEKIDALNKLIEFINSTRNDPKEFRKAMQDSLRAVLKRFALADGMEKITITEDFKIRADGDDNKKNGEQRTLNCFSSGQRAQLGMAWLVAGRELLHSPANKDIVNFPHRIMIMDDPSTTFDLTNLHSQAILWRQLAYNSDPERRYQIFIVSHHEEFSARLLDLLCPPGTTKHKCSMKLIRFTDWQPKKGSTFKAFDVEPAPKDIDAAWELFQKGLTYLENNYEQTPVN